VEQRGRPPVAALTTAALTVMVTHTTGVLWVACVGVVIALLRPRTWWGRLFRRSPRRLTSAALLVLAGGLGCVAYVLLAKPNALGADTGAFGSLAPAQLVSGQLVWALQTIGAFPLRDNPAPMIVYALWLVG